MINFYQIVKKIWKVTMMLRGAAKTLTEMAAQIQPTIFTRRCPCARKYVPAVINPSDDTLNRRISLVVKTCKITKNYDQNLLIWMNWIMIKGNYWHQIIKFEEIIKKAGLDIYTVYLLWILLLHRSCRLSDMQVQLYIQHCWW